MIKGKHWLLYRWAFLLSLGTHLKGLIGYLDSAVDSVIRPSLDRNLNPLTSAKTPQIGMFESPHSCISKDRLRQGKTENIVPKKVDVASGEHRDIEAINTLSGAEHVLSETIRSFPMSENHLGSAKLLSDYMVLHPETQTLLGHTSNIDHYPFSENEPMSFEMNDQIYMVNNKLHVGCRGPSAKVQLMTDYPLNANFGVINPIHNSHIAMNPAQLSPVQTRSKEKKFPYDFSEEDLDFQSNHVKRLEDDPKLLHKDKKSHIFGDSHIMRNDHSKFGTSLQQSKISICFEKEKPNWYGRPQDYTNQSKGPETKKTKYCGNSKKPYLINVLESIENECQKNSHSDQDNFREDDPSFSLGSKRGFMDGKEKEPAQRYLKTKEIYDKISGNEDPDYSFNQKSGNRLDSNYIFSLSNLENILINEKVFKPSGLKENFDIVRFTSISEWFDSMRNVEPILRYSYQGNIVKQGFGGWRRDTKYDNKISDNEVENKRRRLRKASLVEFERKRSIWISSCRTESEIMFGSQSIIQLEDYIAMQNLFLMVVFFANLIDHIISKFDNNEFIENKNGILKDCIKIIKKEIELMFSQQKGKLEKNICGRSSHQGKEKRKNIQFMKNHWYYLECSIRKSDREDIKYFCIEKNGKFRNGFKSFFNDLFCYSIWYL